MMDSDTSKSQMKKYYFLFLCFFLIQYTATASEFVEGLEQIKQDIRSCHGNFMCLGSWIIRYRGELGPNQTLDLKMLPEGAFVTEKTVDPSTFSVRLVNYGALLTPGVGNLRDIGVSVAVSDNVNGQGSGQCEIYVTFVSTGNFSPIQIERLVLENRFNVRVTLDPPDSAELIRFSGDKIFFRRAIGDISPIFVYLQLYDAGRWYAYEAPLPGCTVPLPIPVKTCPNANEKKCSDTSIEKKTGQNGKELILVYPGFYQSMAASHETIFLDSFWASDLVSQDEFARFLNETYVTNDRYTDAKGNQLIIENHPLVAPLKSEDPKRGILSTIFGWPIRLFQSKKINPYATIDASHGADPMTHISWVGAKAYCLFYGLDLPTEYEIEKYLLDHPSQAQTGISYGEWTMSFYSERLPVDFPLLNPKGPSRGEYYLTVQKTLPVTWVRNAFAPEFRSSQLGFRCVSAFQ